VEAGRRVRNGVAVVSPLQRELPVVAVLPGGTSTTVLVDPRTRVTARVRIVFLNELLLFQYEPL
jgi:hypothetical protein